MDRNLKTVYLHLRLCSEDSGHIQNLTSKSHPGIYDHKSSNLFENKQEKPCFRSHVFLPDIFTLDLRFGKMVLESSSSDDAAISIFSFPFAIAFYRLQFSGIAWQR